MSANFVKLKVIGEIRVFSYKSFLVTRTIEINILSLLRVRVQLFTMGESDPDSESPIRTLRVHFASESQKLTLKSQSRE